MKPTGVKFGKQNGFFSACEEAQFRFETGAIGELTKMQKEWIKEHGLELINRYAERTCSVPVTARGKPDNRYHDDVVPFVKGFQGSEYKVNGEKKRKQWRKV